MAMHNFIDRARVRSCRGVHTAGGCSWSLHGRGIIRAIFARDKLRLAAEGSGEGTVRACARGRLKRAWFGLAGERRLENAPLDIDLP